MNGRPIGYWGSTGIVAFALLSGGAAQLAHCATPSPACCAWATRSTS